MSEKQSYEVEFVLKTSPLTPLEIRVRTHCSSPEECFNAINEFGRIMISKGIERMWNMIRKNISGLRNFISTRKFKKKSRFPF